MFLKHARILSICFAAMGTFQICNANPITFLIGTWAGYHIDANFVSPCSRNTPYTDNHAIFRWIADIVLTSLCHGYIHRHVYITHDDLAQGFTSGLLFYSCNECIKVEQNRCHKQAEAPNPPYNTAET